MESWIGSFYVLTFGSLAVYLFCFFLEWFQWRRPLPDNGYGSLRVWFSEEDWNILKPCLERLPSWRIPTIQEFFARANSLSVSDKNRIRSDVSHSIVGAFKTLESSGAYAMSLFFCLLFTFFGTAKAWDSLFLTEYVVLVAVGLVYLISSFFVIKRLIYVQRLEGCVAFGAKRLRELLNQ